MAYIPDATIAAFRGNGNLGIFFRLATDPALHLAFSLNDVPISMPDESDGVVYQGAGRLVDVPALEVLINGLADKVVFTLDGIDPVLAAEMLDTAPAVLGARVTVGIAAMDYLWQPATPIAALWTGTADFLAEQMQVETDPTKNRVQSISLNTTAGDASRAFPNLLTYSDTTQQLLHPGDTMFNRLARYISTFLVSWPRF